MDKSDEDLVNQMQEGSIRAFEELVRRYQKRLVVFAARLVHDDALADDVVIESLFSLYKTIDRVDTSKKFSSYLFTMVRNGSYSALRKKRPHVPLTEALTVVSDEPSFFDEYDRENVGRALNKIRKDYAVVLRLYYFDQLSYEEIAKKVRLPIGTVRTHISRGKAALGKIL